MNPRLLSNPARRRAGDVPKAKSSPSCVAGIELLENRIAPASHSWTGLGGNSLWSNSQNWTNGAPSSDASDDIDLVFHTNLTNSLRLTMQNDLVGLVVDSITFTANGGTVGATTFANGGTTTSGYIFGGNAISIDTAGTGQGSFGIDVEPGVANSTSPAVETFHTDIHLMTKDATFRSQKTLAFLLFTGDLDLGGHVLTIDNTAGASNNAGILGVVINGDISNGDLMKTGTGSLKLGGNNSFANAMIDGGLVVVTSNMGLGAAAGVVTVTGQSPSTAGQLQLRGGVTVAKATLNLNSNAVGGGLAATGNTTNTFHGSIFLNSGNATPFTSIGSGDGIGDAQTRLVVDGVISGAPSALFLNGAGVIEFTKNNSYTGLTNYTGGSTGFGALQIDAPGGLGAGGAGNETFLTVNGAGPLGSALWLNFNGTLQNGAGVGEDIGFAGSGVDGRGAIRTLGNSNVVLPGELTLNIGGSWTVAVDGDRGSIVTTSVIDDEGANRTLTKTGPGTLVIGGTAVNTYSGGTIVGGGVLSVQNNSANPLGDTPTVAVPNAVTVSNGAVFRVESGIAIPNGVNLFSGGVLAGTGSIGGSVVSSGGVVSPGGSTGILNLLGGITLGSTSAYEAEVNGLVAGSQYDQIKVTGMVSLGDASLLLTGGFPAVTGDTIKLIDNDGSADAVLGTFAGLPEGAPVSLAGQLFKISYAGGDGNDVVLTATTASSDLAISANGRTATFTDVDGDLVTIKTTLGFFAPTDFNFGFADNDRLQLQKLNLDALEKGANITVTAKRTANGGNGFTSIGYINATGVDLGMITIAGDLGRIDAGAVKSLTVQSLGAFGLSTQALGGSLVSHFAGKFGTLTVKSSIHNATVLGLSSIGTVGVLGSFVGGQISAGADLGAVSIRGDIVGTATVPVVISAFGKAPAKGIDVAIKSITVAGGVENLRVLAGYDIALAGKNADASIGTITVGADWRASTVLTGVTEGGDGFAGTIDDEKFVAPTHDVGNVFSQIAAITIKGQAFGTILPGDSFGIVAEKILAAKIGTVMFKFDTGERDPLDVFAAAPTRPGPSNAKSDFFIREAIK